MYFKIFLIKIVYISYKLETNADVFVFSNLKLRNKFLIGWY